MDNSSCWNSDMLWHLMKHIKSWLLCSQQSSQSCKAYTSVYTSRHSRHVKVNMCSEYLVGGWDRHRKKATQNGTKFPWFKVKKRVASNRLNYFRQPQSTRLPKTPRRGDADVTWDLAQWMLEQKDLQLRTLRVANVSCLEVHYSEAE